MNPLLILGALVALFSRRSPMDAAALGAGPRGNRERTGPVPSALALVTAPVSREQVAAAQAGVVRIAQEMAGGRSPRRRTVRDLRAALGLRAGGWDRPLRERLALALGDEGERVSPSAGPEQRAARRLLAQILTVPRVDPVVMRGFQVQLGTPATGRLDAATGARVAQLFGRA